MVVRTHRLFAVSFKKDLFFIMCLWEALYACECICLWRPEVSDGAGNTGTFEPPDMGARD